jgi:plastocyanin
MVLAQSRSGGGRLRVYAAGVRAHRLAFPLAVGLCLALAAPANAAFDWKVDVTNYQFTPGAQKISVGDTVTWNFVDEGHTSASLPGQPDSWRSGQGSTGTTPNAAGTSYTQRFDVPGKYQYVCLQHSFMKGTVEVGTDTVVNTVSKFRAKRTGHRVKVSFRLNEPATITYRLKGPSKRTVKKGRLATGAHSFTLKRLKRGSYNGVLTAADDFDKKITPKNHFEIR